MYRFMVSLLLALSVMLTAPLIHHTVPQLDAIVSKAAAANEENILYVTCYAGQGCLASVNASANDTVWLTAYYEYADPYGYYSYRTETFRDACVWYQSCGVRHTFYPSNGWEHVYAFRLQDSSGYANWIYAGP
jgi:hypothetical protein